MRINIPSRRNITTSKFWTQETSCCQFLSVFCRNISNFFNFLIWRKIEPKEFGSKRFRFELLCFHRKCFENVSSRLNFSISRKTSQEQKSNSDKLKNSFSASLKREKETKVERERQTEEERLKDIENERSVCEMNVVIYKKEDRRKRCVYKRINAAEEKEKSGS